MKAILNTQNYSRVDFTATPVSDNGSPLFSWNYKTLWTELPRPENPANSFARHTETLDSCFDLMSH